MGLQVQDGSGLRLRISGAGSRVYIEVWGLVLRGCVLASRIRVNVILFL